LVFLALGGICLSQFFRLLEEFLETGWVVLSCHHPGVVVVTAFDNPKFFVGARACIVQFVCLPSGHEVVQAATDEEHWNLLKLLDFGQTVPVQLQHHVFNWSNSLKEWEECISHI